MGSQTKATNRWPFLLWIEPKPDRAFMGSGSLPHRYGRRPDRSVDPLHGKPLTLARPFQTTAIYPADANYKTLVGRCSDLKTQQHLTARLAGQMKGACIGIAGHCKAIQGMHTQPDFTWFGMPIVQTNLHRRVRPENHNLSGQRRQTALLALWHMTGKADRSPRCPARAQI